MNGLDWVVLVGTLLFIVVYGVWKTRGSKDAEGFLKGGNSMKWWTIGLSVMATQASAITFLSTPGQAYEDGLRFLQMYLGVPIALIIISAVFVPIFYRQKVYTAYEYLENRFDVNTRVLGASIFMIQRALGAGISIYAPSIILSTALAWPLSVTNLIIGILVIIYTVSGGTKAVNQTHKQQMLLMIVGMLAAGVVVFRLLPSQISVADAVNVAGGMGRINAITFSFDFSDRYNIWSGIIGGMFLALAYFGTDQSQVQRYLSGQSIAESRLGLMMTALLKVPMQLLILSVGILVFVFYQFYQPPLFFIEKGQTEVLSSAYASEWNQLQRSYTEVFDEKKSEIYQYLTHIDRQQSEAEAISRQKINQLKQQEEYLKQEARVLVERTNPTLTTEDTDYVFLTFITQHFPQGLVGLLLAVIFSAAMSTTASELNALSITATVDMYRRLWKPDETEQHYVKVSRWFTVLWGAIALAFAAFASLSENLIEFVNIAGSIFYGTMLGIFLVAFRFRWIQARAVFLAALIAQITVMVLFVIVDISFLWFIVLGSGLVIGLASLFQTTWFRDQ